MWVALGARRRCEATGVSVEEGETRQSPGPRREDLREHRPQDNGKELPALSKV